MLARKTLSDTVLLHLVSLKRPYGSPTEGAVIPYLIGVLPSGPKWVDPAGNLHVDMRTDKAHRTLFVAHTDTVHRKDGPNAVHIDGAGLYGVGDPLGADDAAGVSILCAMIGHTPGYYIFTRGEERGGIGSKYLADHHGLLLAEFDRAIAFDRKGTADVITHQAAGRCCSEIFAEALSSALNDQGMMYMPCDGGVYTDTAEFVGIIPECTNISAGYYSEHTPKEWLDTEHHTGLLYAALNIDWDLLPVKREPGDDGWDDDGLSSWGYSTGSSIKGPPEIFEDGDDIICAACDRALDGHPSDLITLVAEYIDPEQPDNAVGHLSRSYFTPQNLEKVIRGESFWEQVLATLADDSYVQF